MDAVRPADRAAAFVRARLAGEGCRRGHGARGPAGAGRDGVRTGLGAAADHRAVRHHRPAARVRRGGPVTRAGDGARLVARAADPRRDRAARGERSRRRGRPRRVAVGGGRRDRGAGRARPVRIPRRVAVRTGAVRLPQRHRADDRRQPAAQGVRLLGGRRRTRRCRPGVRRRRGRRRHERVGGRHRCRQPGGDPADGASHQGGAGRARRRGRRDRRDGRLRAERQRSAARRRSAVGLPAAEPARHRLGPPERHVRRGARHLVRRVRRHERARSRVRVRSAGRRSTRTRSWWRWAW